ncbi:hypothetical protein ES703_95249 [subsurface metagenome]
MKYEYPFTWHCPVCDQVHTGDLARSPREVKTEVSLDGVRPDILLSSTIGKYLVAIEVVVTHRPEQEAIEAYKRLKIPVLLVEPGWEDLEKFRNCLGLVEAWQATCKAERCPKCHRILRTIEAGSVYGYPCWKCGKKMRILIFEGDSPGGLWGTPKSMIPIAKELGVELKSMYSATAGGKYLAHYCPSCGAIQGDYYVYLESEWIFTDEANKPDRSVEYYYCEKCDIWIEKKRAAKSITALQTLNPCEREKGTHNE